MSTDLRVRAECREWLTLLHSGDANEIDRARFSAWLLADPQHQRAYARLRSLWDEIGELKQLATLESIPSLPATRIQGGSRWKRVSLAAAAGMAALTLLLVWNHIAAPPAHPPVAGVAFEQAYSTAIAEVREVSLPDGTTLTLGARSRASVNFTDSKRYVRLEQGEAFFTVAKDATKPFYVEAGNATLRVVGTRFEVHRGSERVRIAVAEGAVAVEGTNAPLTLGQRIDVLANGTLTAVDSIAGNEIGAWREGRLIYENASIEEIVADIGRYRSDVTLRSEDAGKLRVTAGLRIDQIDPFLNGLPAILPVQIVRDGTSILIDRRP